MAASGSFSVILDDGTVKRTFVLNRPYQGLLIVPGIWRELDDFSSGSVCLVLASQVYEEADYIRNILTLSIINCRISSARIGSSCSFNSLTSFGLCILSSTINGPFSIIWFENNAYFFLTIRYSKSRFKNDAFGHT